MLFEKVEVQPKDVLFGDLIEDPETLAQWEVIDIGTKYLFIKIKRVEQGSPPSDAWKDRPIAISLKGWPKETRRHVIRKAHVCRECKDVYSDTQDDYLCGKCR